MYYDAWHNVLKRTQRRDGLLSYQISFAGLYEMIFRSPIPGHRWKPKKWCGQHCDEGCLKDLRNVTSCFLPGSLAFILMFKGFSQCLIVFQSVIFIGFPIFLVLHLEFSTMLIHFGAPKAAF